MSLTHIQIQRKIWNKLAIVFELSLHVAQWKTLVSNFFPFNQYWFYYNRKCFIAENSSILTWMTVKYIKYGLFLCCSLYSVQNMQNSFIISMIHLCVSLGLASTTNATIIVILLRMLFNLYVWWNLKSRTTHYSNHFISFRCNCLKCEPVNWRETKTKTKTYIQFSHLTLDDLMCVYFVQNIIIKKVKHSLTHSHMCNVYVCITCVE